MHIRWLIRRDMPEVIEIEQASFEVPWDEEYFLRVLRQRNCIGMVATIKDHVVGYVVYELQKHQIFLLNLVVHPEHCRNGIGRALVQRLEDKLTPTRRTEIKIIVSDHNLTALQFFKGVGFIATGVMKSSHVKSDGIMMTFQNMPTGEEVWEWVLDQPQA